MTLDLRVRGRQRYTLDRRESKRSSKGAGALNEAILAGLESRRTSATQDQLADMHSCRGTAFSQAEGMP